jgi:hypothetical protein
VQPGQVWASNDGRDRRNGVRQERIVLGVLGVNGGSARIAYLYTLPGVPHQSESSCGIEGEAILRHRYVRDATTAERQRFGL